MLFADEMSRRKCTSAIALGAIVFLCALVVTVWVQFSQGAFDRRRSSHTAKDHVIFLSHTTMSTVVKNESKLGLGAHKGESHFFHLLVQNVIVRKVITYNLMGSLTLFISSKAIVSMLLSTNCSIAFANFSSQRSSCGSVWFRTIVNHIFKNGKLPAYLHVCVGRTMTKKKKRSVKVVSL